MKMIRNLSITHLYVYILFVAVTCTTEAVELDVPYVETPPELVEVMMDIAEIGPDDYVIDLGTGDGRILIAAANRGATGIGVDLDPVKVGEARQNAKDAGINDKVEFIEQDLFETDLSNATVITLFLNEEVNMRLRPALLKLKPGTKIVSHMFTMGDWQPLRYQQVIRNNDGNFLIHEVFYWEVPANN
jgi:cyclopropane fatty-acyl-phospholipid synthase-like methyltransferase